MNEAGEEIEESAFSILGDFVVPYVFSILFVITLFTASGFLLQGVSEEKEGRIIEILSVAGASRIIMTEPPVIPDDSNLPGWAAAMNASVPVYVPTRHRLADLSTRDGFIDIKADPDGVLRREGDRVVFDYEYCKGCGVCVSECSRAVIYMKAG